jgi:hypothetical protein
MLSIRQNLPLFVHPERHVSFCERSDIVVQSFPHLPYHTDFLSPIGACQEAEKENVPGLPIEISCIVALGGTGVGVFVGGTGVGGTGTLK